MFFIAGVSPRLKQLGIAGGECPACGESGRLYIVKQSQSLSLFFIPLITFGGEYIVTCGNCASIMALRKDAGKRLERSHLLELDSRDFKLVKNNHGPRCPACGRRALADHSFCPGCGSRL